MQDPPSQSTSPVSDVSGPFRKLIDTVLADAKVVCRRIHDRGVNASRDLVHAAEKEVESLSAAARELGSKRGATAEAACMRSAQREVETVLRASRGSLVERFEARVRMALNQLRQSPRYERAIASHFAVCAAKVMDRPSEVRVAKQDRDAVYDALLEAGAEDFQVVVDHAQTVGFEVLDLDGRRLYSCRPDALIDTHQERLGQMAEGAVAPFEAPPDLLH